MLDLRGRTCLHQLSPDDLRAEHLSEHLSEGRLVSILSTYLSIYRIHTSRNTRRQAGTRSARAPTLSGRNKRQSFKSFSKRSIAPEQPLKKTPPVLSCFLFYIFFFYYKVTLISRGDIEKKKMKNLKYIVRSTSMSGGPRWKLFSRSTIDRTRERSCA